MICLKQNKSTKNVILTSDSEVGEALNSGGGISAARSPVVPREELERSSRGAREELERSSKGRMVGPESEEPKSATEPSAQSARGSRAVHIACVRPRRPISVITTDYLGPPGTKSATAGLYLTLGPFPVIFGIPPLLDYFHSDRIQFFSVLQFSDCVYPVQ